MEASCDIVKLTAAAAQMPCGNLNYVLVLCTLTTESSEREIKFYGSLFTCSIKCNIKQFHVVVIQKRQRNLQKSMVQV